jgi:acyl carrier protein
VTFLEARKTVLRALDATTDIFDEAHLNRTISNPDADLTFLELELDSLAAVECCQALEHDIDIDIDPADLAIHDSINKLARYLVERTRAD